MKTDIVNSHEPLVSIIIRTRNEERWIGSCLRAVFNQKYKNIEVIVVDNCSTDQTLRRLEDYQINLLTIDKFQPGKAINEGIRASNGEYLVCLSGHCIPTSDEWLNNLINDLSDPFVAGVYGRQEPLSFSSDLDKRDLLTVFGLDKKIQIKDYFFHNANSAFTRETWEKFPFDEEVTNIEDRVWGRQVIADGKKIIYEPTASVYHWHGINHDLNPERARKIVRILETLEKRVNVLDKFGLDRMNIIAIIPIRGKSLEINGKSLLEYTLKSISQSSLINSIIVSTDNEETADLAKSHGALVPFLRPLDLSEDYHDVRDVLSYSIRQIEKIQPIVDIVVSLDETYPFRPPKLLDNMIRHLVQDGLDTVVAAKPEMRGLILANGNQYEISRDGFMPRELKKTRPLIALTGLACVTHASFIRNGEVLGDKLGVYEINDPLSAEPVRDKIGVTFAEEFIEAWWNKYYPPV